MVVKEVIKETVKPDVQASESDGRNRLYKSLINLPSKKVVGSGNHHGKYRSNLSGKPMKFKRWRRLPPEIVCRILSMLNSENDQQTLVQCLLVNKMFYHVAKEVLYSCPHFTSTYRVAQFVTCLRQCEDNALLVRKLDLSQLRSSELTVLGGSWREWQTRGSTTTRKYGHKSSVSVGSLESHVSSNNSSSISGSQNNNNYYYYSNARGNRSNSSVSNLSSSSGSSSGSSSSSSSGESGSFGDNQGKWSSLWSKFKNVGKENKTLVRSTVSRPTHHKKSASITSVSNTSGAGAMKVHRHSDHYHHHQHHQHHHHHPSFATKNLAPYSSYKDLPLGHLLHLLHLCKNLTHVDLSHLILSADFELPSSNQPKPRSMVPGAPVEPRAVYLTDSIKPWDINNTNYNKSQLRKLSPEIVFEILLQRPAIRQLRMDNIVWVRQTMVTNYVLEAFGKGRNIDLLSFNKSGLHRHLAWTCQGSLQDLVALITMDYVASSDDLALQGLFPTTTQLHPDVLEISQVFPIKLQLSAGIESEFMVRLTVLKTTGVTGYRLRKLCPQYLSLVILLGENSHSSQNQLNVVDKRLAKRTRIVLRRLRELRNTDFRRALGQNYLFPGAAEI